MKEGDGKEPEAKRKRQTKEDSSSGSEDEEAGGPSHTDHCWTVKHD